MIANNLVGGWPTPLKNDGLRQLGWHSQWKNEKKCSKPPTRENGVLSGQLMWPKHGTEIHSNFQSFAQRPQGPMDQKKNTHPIK